MRTWEDWMKERSELKSKKSRKAIDLLIEKTKQKNDRRTTKRKNS